jgi:imidazolonepropionase
MVFDVPVLLDDRKLAHRICSIAIYGTWGSVELYIWAYFRFGNGIHLLLSRRPRKRVGVSLLVWFLWFNSPMLIHSASQLLTLAGGPQRGRSLGNLGIIEDGALVVRDERIVAVGSTPELRASFPDEPTLDAGRSVVMPGFVDPHTHLIWAGDRANEFEMKMAGTPYLDILAAGGGILSTVRATRTASMETLIAQTRPRLLRMFAHGTTTAEVKTGYGLKTSTEFRLLKALLALDDESPLDLAITFLGAHAIAPEFKDDPQGYVDEVSGNMLPMLKEWWETHAPRLPLPFVDVFCENRAFTYEQSRQVLTTARALGFPLKIHADEFDNLGGASLAAELGAASADHLVKTSDADIAALARSETVAVALPCTPFGLAEHDYTPAKKLIEAGAMLALATDCNPGTSWNESMQFAIALACRYMKLTPAQAIAAATINAAHAIRKAHEVGSVETGKQADLLILSVSDYRQVGYRYGTNLVRQVIKRGRVYSVDVGYYRTA